MPAPVGKSHVRGEIDLGRLDRQCLHKICRPGCSRLWIVNVLRTALRIQMAATFITHYQASHILLGQDGSIAYCRLPVYELHSTRQGQLFTRNGHVMRAPGVGEMPLKTITIP